MKMYLLKWKMHIYTVQLKEKEIRPKEQYFGKFEDLLACYREKKNALFCGLINYNTDFEVFTVEYTQQDIKKLDAYL